MCTYIHAAVQHAIMTLKYSQEINRTTELASNKTNMIFIYRTSLVLKLTFFKIK